MDDGPAAWVIEQARTATPLSREQAIACRDGTDIVAVVRLPAATGIVVAASESPALEPCTSRDGGAQIVGAQVLDTLPARIWPARIAAILTTVRRGSARIIVATHLMRPAMVRDVELEEDGALPPLAERLPAGLLEDAFHVLMTTAAGSRLVLSGLPRALEPHQPVHDLIQWALTRYDVPRLQAGGESWPPELPALVARPRQVATWLLDDRGAVRIEDSAQHLPGRPGTSVVVAERSDRALHVLLADTGFRQDPFAGIGPFPTPGLDTDLQMIQPGRGRVDVGRHDDEVPRMSESFELESAGGRDLVPALRGGMEAGDDQLAILVACHSGARLAITYRPGPDAVGLSLADMAARYLARLRPLEAAVPELSEIDVGESAITESSLQAIAGPRPSTAWSIDQAMATVAAAAMRLVAPALSEPDMAEVMRQLLPPPVDKDRASRLLAARPVSGRQLLNRPDGLLATSMLLAEHLVEEREHGRPADVVLFAAALTCALVHSIRTHDETASTFVMRLCRLAMEWVTGGQRRPYRGQPVLETTDLPARAITELDRLVEHAPWLAWFRRGPAGARISLSVAQLVDVLTLVRPRHHYRGAAGRGVLRTVAGEIEVDELTERYLLPAGLEALAEDGGRLLNELARLLQSLHRYPVEVLQGLQVLDGIEDVREVVAERVRALYPISRGRPADLLALVDRPNHLSRTRLLLVNRSRTARLEVALDDGTIRLLEPLALEKRDAVDYFTEPLSLDGDEVRLNVAGASLEIPLTPRPGLDQPTNLISDRLDPRLFRGREAELRDIRRQMHDDVGDRSPIGLFGPRRAGKTTLANHACERAQAAGLLSGYAFVRVVGDLSRQPAAGFARELGRVLVRETAVALGRREAALGHGGEDPVELLLRLDRELEGARPLAVVLDEFDVMLAQPAGSEANFVAARLGALRFRNLVLIGTMQRSFGGPAELKTWHMVRVSSDLSWLDGLTYFCEPLLALDGDHSSKPVTRSLVTPRLFRDVVRRRVGLRPYFWGQVRDRIEGLLRAEPERHGTVPGDLLNEIIDRIVDADTYLNNVLVPTEDRDAWEIRTSDLFSTKEKRVLALIACRGERELQGEEAVAAGGVEAVDDLISREFLRRRGSRLVVAVPLFREHLHLHQVEFIPYLKSTGRAQQARRRPPRGAAGGARFEEGGGRA